MWPLAFPLMGIGRNEWGRTVESLGGVRDVRHTEVACQEDNAYREVQPWTGADVREEHFGEEEECVQGVDGDVVPCWKALSVSG